MHLHLHVQRDVRDVVDYRFRSLTLPVDRFVASRPFFVSVRKKETEYLRTSIAVPTYACRLRDKIGGGSKVDNRLLWQPLRERCDICVIWQEPRFSHGIPTRAELSRIILLVKRHIQVNGRHRLTSNPLSIPNIGPIGQLGDRSTGTSLLRMVSLRDSRANLVNTNRNQLAVTNAIHISIGLPAVWRIAARGCPRPAMGLLWATDWRDFAGRYVTTLCMSAEPAGGASSAALSIIARRRRCWRN